MWADGRRELRGARRACDPKPTVTALIRSITIGDVRGQAGDASTDQRFDIVRPLGSGGFGAVYEAIDNTSETRVALKELTRVGSEALFRFKHEFRALAGVHHPNLVSLKELFEQAGRWYIVMELIEGRDLLEFVRTEHGAGFDEERLRKAFAGVARGLEALHGHGLLHRDLKPSNVRVTGEGRAVLLDFGLATGMDGDDQSTHAHGVGTVLYMAPEQFDGRLLGPSADWYAFGTCLYEALTGQRPFEGATALSVALQKQRAEPAPPGALAPGLPEDLSSLCAALLRIAPDQRPSGAAVMSVRSRCSISASRPANKRSGEGESGVGKSELVAEFLRRQQAREPRTLTLRGRCYENEHVSYKAFDGCVDELARALQRMGPSAQTVMPLEAGLLAQLFPVLGGVPAIARAKGGHAAADPIARRLQAFAALSALLSQLAEERPLILAIDDLQWSDSESFRLLRALVEDARRPPILVLCTVRPRDEIEPEVLSQLEALRALQCVDVIPIVGLPRPQAEELARRLLGPEADPRWASIIAVESRGHPLFLGELIQFSRSRDLGASGSLTLEAALEARIAGLPKDACALLELVAIAARPHRAALFALALGAPNVDEAVSVLLAARLLRARRDQELGCFHDRIRHVAVGMVARFRLPLLHRQLAEALERDFDADPTELATHWDLAEAPEQAVDAYERAAAQARTSLAFAQAERLYARALELLGTQSDARYAQLLVGRADALGCAGRSAEAATLYQRAAALDGSEEQRLRLRTKTAQHLMLSGDVITGMNACRRILLELGVSLPRSELGAVLRAIWDRVRLRMSGYALRGSESAHVGDARARLVLELVYELMKALAILRTTAFLALSGQHTRRALALGDPVHGALAYANEAWLNSTSMKRRAAAGLFERSRALCARTGNPTANALLAQQQGSAAVANWRWAEGSALLEEAERLYQAHVAHDPWSLTVTRYLLGVAWYRLGEHRRLAERMELWIGEARERLDRVAVALLSGMGHGSARHLMRGAPRDALAELDEAIAAVPAEPFAFAHLGHMIGTQQALMLAGARAAFDWLESRKRKLESPLLLRTRFGREAVYLLRSAAALRACEDASATERKLLSAEVRKNARWLARQKSPFTRAISTYFSAQLAALEGAPERALALAREARQGFAQLQSNGTHGAAYLEGLLEGGEAGAQRCARALSAFREQGWAQPEDAMLLTLPSLAALARRAGPGRRPRKNVVHHYELLGPLGGGGFGAVFEARDVQSGRSVALKELVSSSARSLERFKQEFRALSDLHHPNLVRFDALFEHEGTWYIVMELVRGEDLISYVRPGGTLDLARLRRAFAGLFAGVGALHDAGFVHRDIQPGNVCVTPEGRAVLLDFGLIARARDARDTAPLGNPEYAPPEQLEGATPHASADIYALGGCLYQALAGRLPFDGAQAPPSAAHKRARRPRGLTAPELRSWGACALQMLSPHPAERPALAEVMSMLSGERAPDAARPASLSLIPDLAGLGAFHGRSTELAQLEAAFARSRGGFELVLIEGESGLGKSALAAELARRLAREHPGLSVFASRCYENERLALKAFDGVVDQLAAVLRSLPLPACEALLPKKAALLAQLFPVLGSVFAIAKASKKGLPADPSARRQLGLHCFVELLERLSAQRTLLILIDDLQWADVESARLLATLSRRAAALPLLVVCTMRPRAELAAELAGELAALGTLRGTTALVLERLSPEDAQALSTSLLGDSADAELLRRLSDESRGHPLLLRELVEHARAGAPSAGAAQISLDEAVRARLERLDAQARALVTLLAIAGRPHGSQAFARALGLAELPRETVNALLNQGLVRRRGEDRLTYCHDTLRLVALAGVSAAQRRALSAALARALESEHEAEPAERARLWDEAGCLEQAVPALEAAGDCALEKLAFEAAAQHFGRALELLGNARDERFCRLASQRGHALVRMGKNAQAARLYEAAAQVAEGEQRVRLRIWAAQNLIQGARVEEGLAAAARLLRELGVPMPESPERAVLRVVWESTRLRVRGIALRQRAAPLASAERLVLDALNELSQPVTSVTFLKGSALSVQHLRRALDAGEPAHAARALAYEGLLRSTKRPRDDHSALFARARELALASGDPAVRASVEVRHGMAHLTRDDYEAARDALLRGHEIVSLHCPGQPWLLATARMQLGVTWYVLEEYDTLAAHAEAWVADAKRREDLYGYAVLAGYGFGFIRHLMRDDPAAARAELAEAMAPWPETPFSTNHFGAILATQLVMHYEGGDAALRWFDQHQARLQGAAILKNPIFKLTITNLQMVACLAALCGDRERDAAALARAEQQLRSVRKLPRSPLNDAFCTLWSSALHALRGDRERALLEARHARDGLCRHYRPYGTLASYWEGWLEGGQAGQLRCERALAAVRARGWARPERALARLLPILRLVPQGPSQRDV